MLTTELGTLVKCHTLLLSLFPSSFLFAKKQKSCLICLTLKEGCKRNNFVSKGIYM